MIKLNPEAIAFLDVYKNRNQPSQWSQDQKRKFERIELSYNRLIQIIMYINQDAIAADLLTQQEQEDLYHAIGRIKESLLWVKYAIGVPEDDPNYDLEWVLLNENKNHGCGILAESYKLVSQKLIKECNHCLFLQYALTRLMNSYYLGGEVCDRSIAKLEQATRQQRQMIDNSPTRQKTKRVPTEFVHNVQKSNPIAKRIKRIINATKLI